ncbi:hypothetical protein NDU88_001073 [Pleurodeles waltl]|uniref:Uncharacterized protein n=1 Tax=Pleurodeles waltl TaxID=8319 RepID=A0AAV7LBJ5_PLEWA|nr:hypothetical protein NDU88_001073 [Pleurodeles waltl]
MSAGAPPCEGAGGCTCSDPKCCGFRCGTGGGGKEEQGGAGPSSRLAAASQWQPGSWRSHGWLQRVHPSLLHAPGSRGRLKNGGRSRAEPLAGGRLAGPGRQADGPASPRGF